MLRTIFNQIKYTITQLPFKRNKIINSRIKESFGKIKDDSFNFKSIERYFRHKDNSASYQILSDKTCNDLDFDELFMYLDRTNSRVGQQYYYNRLRNINIDKHQTELDEKIITEFTKNTELRISIQKKLDQLSHKDSFYIATLFQEEHISRPKRFYIIPVLSFASLITLITSFFIPSFFILLILLFCINFAIHYWNKNNIIQYVNSLPQLLKFNNIASNLFANSLLKKLNPNLLKSIKIINTVRNSMFFFKLEAKLQGEFAIIAWFIFEQIKTLFLLEPLLLFRVLKKLDNKRIEIEDEFKFIGHIDMLISIASLRNGLNHFCIPTIQTNNDTIITNEVKHPLLVNCKTNNINISKKSILLTGSNMSGKTTFIRTIGINIITGLTINTCFAKSFSLPLLKIFSAIRISDDLMNDKSYYFEEVLTIKDMLTESQKNEKSIFLLDEIFKGTNTVERISAGKAVLSSLTKNNNIVLVSTHDIELTDMLSEEYELYHFSETVENKTVGFDYKLKEGKLKNRNAIRILEINDYPKELIKEANKIAEKLDNSYVVLSQSKKTN